MAGRRRRGTRPRAGGSSLAKRIGMRASGRRLWMVVLAAGVVLAAPALEQSGQLPEPFADIVREVEAWAAPFLREVGIDLPSTSTDLEPEAQWPEEASAAARQALALLDRVVVEPERPVGYEREHWPHWVDMDGDCLDTRQAVLAAESLEPVRLSTDGCRVASGLWRDVYTGETFRDPSDLDVDHFVPLAEAYRSGGREWSQERRAAFANDTDDARSLIAVSAAANRAKGDKGPEEWLPPARSYHCLYAANWVAVKVRWALSMDEQERMTVGNILRDCSED